MCQSLFEHLSKAFSDKHNINAEKLLESVKKALERYPIRHTKRGRKRTSTHKLIPKVVARGKDRGTNRIAIHIPAEYRVDPKTGKLRHKYLYYSAKPGDTITPVFLNFFTNYVHTATDNLSVSEMQEWIYGEWILLLHEQNVYEQ